ncbi:hypothetical protein QFZ77_004914 [Paenibacillus sp. V4I3]|uniref:hypothetical protein n=1 Tax=unclassified Paenibacillus TaxID=185978 RepID=UPI0027872A4C|nr:MULTISPECIES: hypothetical protein [unclassified Paenibacillus]MDQ0876255.1 hypothetical protein [Paenibacillus sp. V4I3]MDQ0887712.1 hypothetical protein [Paenibacillus sp. V4I9]
MSIRTNMQDLENIVLLFEGIKNIAVARFVPEAARAHFRLAEKEALLGVKSLLDAAIVRLEEDDSMKQVNDSNHLKQIPVED